MLHSTNSTIWFPTLVLQQGASIVPHEVVEQNAKKSSHLDIWILGAFKSSPSEGIKALMGLIPIKYHLQKLAEQSLI